MNTPVMLSSSTIVTLSAIFLIILFFLLMRKALATIMTAIVIAVLVIIFVQATTGHVLVNLGELGDFTIYYLLKLFDWVQDTFLPRLADVADDINKIAHLRE